jgi:hypothetical protein
MRELLEQRLHSLQAEFEAGQNMLADLEARQANLKETMLRISGAIQVLQEVLGASEQQSGSEPRVPENIIEEAMPPESRRADATPG